jgi:hypothetical protein
MADRIGGPVMICARRESVPHSFLLLPQSCVLFHPLQRDVFVTSDGKKGRMIRTDSGTVGVRTFEQ